MIATPNDKRRKPREVKQKAAVEQGDGGTAIFDLKHFIPYQVVLLSGYFGDELLKVYADYGLSISEWRVLACVAAGPANTAIDIATTSRLDEVAVHRAVTLLIQRGLLRRSLDEEDRRRKPVELTAKGRKIHGKVVPRILAVEQWTLEKLTRAEQQMLRNALSIFCERLGLMA